LTRIISICFLMGYVLFANAATISEMRRVADYLFSGQVRAYNYWNWGVNVCLFAPLPSNPNGSAADWCKNWVPGYNQGHSGYDMTTSSPDGVFYSVSKGEVIRANGTGTIAVYDKELNRTVFYLHAASHKVRVGDQVWVGLPIGIQGGWGANGNNTFPHHVHLEVRQGYNTNSALGASDATSLEPISNVLPFIRDGVILQEFVYTNTTLNSGGEYDSQFKLFNPSYNTTGTINAEKVYLSLHEENGNFIKNIKEFPNVKISNGQTWASGQAKMLLTYPNNTPLLAGKYRLVTKIDTNFNNVYDGRHLGEMIISVNPPAKPNTPNSLSASAISSSSVVLKWTDNATNEQGVYVYSWNGSAWGIIATLGVNATTYTSSGLSPNNTYYYKVSAFNTAGANETAWVSVITPPSTSIPSSVSVNPVNGFFTTAQNLAVTSSGATIIYYTMVDTYDGTTPYTPPIPSSFYYNGYLSGPSASLLFSGNSTQIRRTYMKFVGCNRSTCGPVSDVYGYTIDQRPTKPIAPGNLSATAATKSITVRWSDNSTNESGFYICRWNGVNWGYLNLVGQNITSYTDSGLSPNTTYYYTLCAYNSAGASCPGYYTQAKTTQ